MHAADNLAAHARIPHRVGAENQRLGIQVIIELLAAYIPAPTPAANTGRA